MILQISETWKNKYPNAYVGILMVSNARNLPEHPALESARRDLEDEVRERYGALDRTALREDPVLGAYNAFYKPFRKTYHVQLQLESVVFKGKNIYSPSALVACMFLAELKTGLLTAAHDLTSLGLPLTASAATGKERYIKMDGTEQVLKEGDLYITDQLGIISSVIYGPDQRTQIQADTDQALFTTYGPPGITRQRIITQLELLEGYVKLFAPQAARNEMIVL